MPRFKPLLKLIPPALVGALTLLPAGCYSSDAPIEARGERYPTPWLTMGSEPLRQDTRVGQARQFYDESNLLHVTVPVRNTTDRQLYVSYQFTFYDRAGAAGLLPRHRHHPRRGQAEISGNTTSPRAEGPMPFRLELRYPRVN